MLVRITAILLVLASAITPGCCMFPKMVSETAFNGKPFGNHMDDNTESISSSSFVTFGTCQYNTSFQVDIGGGSGRGVIVASTNQLSITSLSFVDSSDKTSTIVLEDAVGGNFFDMFQGTDQGVTYPFRFDNVTDSGATVHITCAQSSSVDIVVIVKDDSNLVVNAKVRFEASGRQRVELDNDTSEVMLTGTSKGKSRKETAQFKNATKKGISIQADKPGGVVIVHLQVRQGENGKMIRRSIITRTRSAPPTVKAMRLSTSVVDANGDVVVKFAETQNTSQPLKIDARIGITMDKSKTLKECVDVSAIVEDWSLIVHNEWIRQCLTANGLTNQTSGWDVVVLNGTITDPEDNYRLLARLESSATTGIRNNEKPKRQQLASPPSSSKVTQEMQEGRKPRELKRRSLQSLPHRKVLVHGYCAASNPFPVSQFSNYVAFSDPSAPASWSHDTFARKIYSFTSNLGGCGCIAHSQGGPACLHLYTYYYSCLDSPSVAGRRIQSVGSPYQGTALAGSIATLGSIFGAGCGSNTDLTYSGASSWLAGIPSWARSQVYYYTTSFTSLYCSLAAELVLSDPNDGVTEVAHDQLVGANNLGNKVGWCHTTGMRYAAQYTDSSRNAILNANAQY